MRRRTGVVLGGVAATVLLAAGAVHSVGVPTVAGHAASIFGPGVALAAAGRRGWGHGHGRGIARICGDQRDERLGDALEFADAFLRIEPNQTEAWSRLTAALKSGSARVGEACRSLETDGWPAQAPEKLATLETVMAAGLDIVREVRPAFDQFYATLDDRQKEALDGLFDRRR